MSETHVNYRVGHHKELHYALHINFLNIKEIFHDIDLEEVEDVPNSNIHYHINQWIFSIARYMRTILVQ